MVAALSNGLMLSAPENHGKARSLPVAAGL